MLKKLPSMVADKNIEVLNKSLLHSGFLNVYLYRLKHRLFSGEWSVGLDRERVEHKPAVGVLPYDPVLQRLVLIEQFRIGLIESDQSPWLWDIVAGYIEPGEHPEEVAHRELLEETGLEAIHLKPISHYWVSPGSSNAQVTLFYACVDASQAGGVYGLPEEGEDIRVHTLPVDEIEPVLAGGQINNAMALIALQWLQLYRNTL